MRWQPQEGLVSLRRGTCRLCGNATERLSKDHIQPQCAFNVKHRTYVRGQRGLRGGLSLARLLARAVGARNRTSLPRLTLAQVLTWADAHRRRTGSWPTENSGPVVGAPGETWKGVAIALRFGYRGLRGGLSLARQLAAKRGVRNRANLPQLSAAQVIVWAQEHLQRAGAWPNRDSGTVVGEAGETWSGIDMALRYGHRGLPGGSSLAQLAGQGGG
jgi:hypothetical protein